MGEVVDQASGSPKTLEAITPVNGMPPGCTQVQNAWASGGYWTTNATTDLPPAGGLYGAAGIVDVALGTLYAYDATAIDGFSDVVQHSAPGNTKPNLATAISDSAHDIATAYVPIGNSMIKADYTASTAGIDAVSAVLMAYTIATNSTLSPAWVLRLTGSSRFRRSSSAVDPGLVQREVDPFESIFDGVSCDVVYPQINSRDSPPPDPGTCYPENCPRDNYLCYETAVIPFNDLSADDSPSKTLGSLIRQPPFVLPYGIPPAGNMVLRLRPSPMRPASGGDAFYGLPAIGFAATNYINANVTPGVLSNYSGVYPHRASASCAGCQ